MDHTHWGRRVILYPWRPTTHDGQTQSDGLAVTKAAVSDWARCCPSPFTLGKRRPGGSHRTRAPYLPRRTPVFGVYHRVHTTCSPWARLAAMRCRTETTNTRKTSPGSPYDITRSRHTSLRRCVRAGASPQGRPSARPRPKKLTCAQKIDPRSKCFGLGHDCPKSKALTRGQNVCPDSINFSSGQRGS